MTPAVQIQRTPSSGAKVCQDPNPEQTHSHCNAAGSCIELWSNSVGGLAVASKKSGGNLPPLDGQDHPEEEIDTEFLGRSHDGYVDTPEDQSGRLTAPGSADEPVGGYTTVMVRNVPLHVTQQRLILELNAFGFAALYDFCYLPCTLSTGRGNGYAFINFITASAALAFMSSWHMSYRFNMSPKEPALNISLAQLQGKEANVRNWSRSRMRRIRNPKMRPYMGEGFAELVNMIWPDDAPAGELEPDTDAIEASAVNPQKAVTPQNVFNPQNAGTQVALAEATYLCMPVSSPDPSAEGCASSPHSQYGDPSAFMRPPPPTAPPPPAPPNLLPQCSLQQALAACTMPGASMMPPSSALVMLPQQGSQPMPSPSCHTLPLLQAEPQPAMLPPQTTPVMLPMPSPTMLPSQPSPAMLAAQPCAAMLPLQQAAAMQPVQQAAAMQPAPAMLPQQAVAVLPQQPCPAVAQQPAMLQQPATAMLPSQVPPAMFPAPAPSAILPQQACAAMLPQQLSPAMLLPTAPQLWPEMLVNNQMLANQALSMASPQAPVVQGAVMAVPANLAQSPTPQWQDLADPGVPLPNLLQQHEAWQQLGDVAQAKQAAGKLAWDPMGLN